MGDPRGGKRTPIDVVMEWHPDLKVPITEIASRSVPGHQFGEAVTWLWEALGHETDWREEFDAALEGDLAAANEAVVGVPTEMLAGTNEDKDKNKEARPLASATTQPKGSAAKEPAHTKWRERWKGGKPKASLFNARLAITKLGFECRYDRFHETVLVGYSGGEVWHDVRQIVGELSDIAEARLRQMVSARFGFDPTAAFIHDAVKTLAIEHSFDPVLDLLDAAQANWDRRRASTGGSRPTWAARTPSSAARSGARFWSRRCGGRASPAASLTTSPCSRAPRVA